MKKGFLTLTGILFALLSFSQQVIHKSFYSPLLGDSVKYDVWLPRDWNTKEVYPAIYLNSYAVLNQNGMIVAADINNSFNQFPPSIVIEMLIGQESKMDYSYQTGMVGEKGLKTIECLKKELIPEIEAAYKTTQFRAFIGQSYSSSYANYLFLHQPGLFNAYILLTPEKTGADQPAFNITEDLRDYYNTHPTFYYLASAGKDMKRRQDYANEINEKIKVLDPSSFHFKHTLFTDADHNSIINYGLLPGLQYIFSGVSYSVPGNLINIKQWIDSTDNICKIYGIPAKKTSQKQINFLDLVANNKDDKSLDFLADYFNDTSSAQNYIMLANTGYAYRRLGNFLKAAEFYKKSISEGRRRNKPQEMLYGYLQLALQVYWKHDKKIDAAWETLLQCLKDTKDPSIKYYLGQIAAEENFKVDDGIKYLQEFIPDKISGAVPNPFLSISNAYLFLAKCYYSKRDKKNTTFYLNRSLTEGPKNQEALTWMKKMKL